jgi:hypothetical protein
MSVDPGMTNRSAVLRYAGFALAAGIGLSACSELSINERIFKRGPDGLRATTQICLPLEDGSSGGGGGGGEDFWYETHAENGVVSVEVLSGESNRVTRRYDTDFARSGVTDEFTFVTSKGEEYLFRFWGSNPCQSTYPLGSAP